MTTNQSIARQISFGCIDHDVSIFGKVDNAFGDMEMQLSGRTASGSFIHNIGNFYLSLSFGIFERIIAVGINRCVWIVFVK